MGIAKEGNISLRQIRQDVGLPASGSARETAVLNKAGARDGNVAMSEYRGNIYGMQLTQDKSTLVSGTAWNPKLYNHQVIRFQSTSGDASVKNKKVSLTSYQKSYDQGPEMRGEGKVLESGSYRFTATIEVAPERYKLAECHVSVVSNATNFLSGAETVHLNSINTEHLSATPTTVTFTRTFTLSTSQPYITLIGRAISKAGSSTNQAYTHKFYDYKLVKL
jgi:hypothetical protein